MSLTYAEISRAINRVVTERDGEWCGFPMPLPGLGLVLESKHPLAALIATVQQIVDADHPKPAPTHAADANGWRIVNSWSSLKHGGDVVVLHHEDGRQTWGLDPYAPRRNRHWFGPLETLDAWTLDTERIAMDKLLTHVTERQFKSYVLTGTFLETSMRSGISYLFRRCRPTVALGHGSRHDGKRSDEVRVLVALCLHPIGFYANTFAGAMTPTDDVIAHLLLMRGDEAMFWRRANQHAPHTPEAGL